MHEDDLPSTLKANLHSPRIPVADALQVPGTELSVTDHPETELSETELSVTDHPVTDHPVIVHPAPGFGAPVSSDLERPQTRVSTDDGAVTGGGVEEHTFGQTHSRQLAYSTLLSLIVVLVLLVAVRLIVPSLVESVRYGWYRGQLRAEYEMSGERLRTVSLNSLADVSQLVSQHVGPSVVHINLLHNAEDQHPLQKMLLPRSSPHLVEGQGSGFVVDANGYILTNQHVIEGDGRIEVTTSDGRRLAAYVVGVDAPTDLALLKVDAIDLMPIDWGDSEQIVVGSPVWAVGSPFGLQQTVTFGIISGKHRVDLRGPRYETNVKASTAYGDLMQSDVALNPGNSGGPLVNSMGQVVGVNAAILGETYRGISFSIPSKVAKNVAKQLVEVGDVQRGWLGVSMSELDDNQRFDSDGRVQPGVVVVGFPKTGPSPARDAGLKVGDVITQFAGQLVMNQSELMRFIGESDIGVDLPIVLRRGQTAMTINVKLGKREAKIEPR